MEPMRADKDRLAVDLDWLRGIDNIRSEMVVGWDDKKFPDSNDADENCRELPV